MSPSGVRCTSWTRPLDERRGEARCEERSAARQHLGRGDADRGARAAGARLAVRRAGRTSCVSVLWRQPCPIARLPLLSIAAGLAVCEVARRAAAGADVRLKWPNDVVLVGRESDGARSLRKLAGILVETSMAGRMVDAVILGIGLNVHTRDFPDELQGRATSLALLAKAPLDRAELLADLLAALDRETTLVAGRGLGLLRGGSPSGTRSAESRCGASSGQAPPRGLTTRGGSSSWAPTERGWRGARARSTSRGVGPPERRQNESVSAAPCGGDVAPGGRTAAPATGAG